MAWKDLSIAQRSQLMNIMRHNGITSLSEMRRLYDLSTPSLSSLGENTFNMQPQAPVYAGGGNKPPERRKVGDHYLTLEQYKELQRDTIRQAAVQKALTRTRGVAPIINGKPASSCIYTFTDNYGRKYQVAGTQTFAANPEKYGFEVAGPVTEGMEGNMYLQFNESGVPYHATMITGYTDKGEPLLTYSSGHAGVDLTGVPISREDWDRNQRAAESLQRIAGLTPERETYEHYVERFNRSHSPEADYHKNTKAWHSPQYETYRFIGTPDDNALWEQQFSELQPAPIQVGVPQVLNNQIQLGGGGHKIHIKKENRGKFTTLKKRTGKSASWFKAHGTPAQKKMAIFALNSKKWHKKSHGGIKF